MTLWRIYYFNEQMGIVDVQDTIRSKRSAHTLANERVREHGWYTYAIGKLS